LTPLLAPAPASIQIETLQAFLADDMAPLLEDDPFALREREARRVLGELLGQLAAAHRAHHDPDWTIADLALAVRTAIGSETAQPAAADGPGIHLVDDQEARFGDFDEVTLVGLIEHEWPERPRRSIFYPPELMRALGWPSEKDRRAAETGHALNAARRDPAGPAVRRGGGGGGPTRCSS
jgi:inactivated superfamily I helicase